MRKLSALLSMSFLNIVTLLGGLTFFLYGMKVMSKYLEKIAGGRLESTLQQVTDRPLLSITLGAVITIAMQSSSATTVMLVGLVNSGIMQLSQTVSVIFGANIGTTLTAWILSLSGIESSSLWLQMLKPENFSPILAFIGILLIMISKRDRKVSIGHVLVGFALLMSGMTLMKDAMSPLAKMPSFSDMLVKFNNPFLGLFIGLAFTAVIQSSAASIGIMQALSLSSGISYAVAIPIVLGVNIGTCATSLISAVGTSKGAQRVAVLHVSIKIIGSIFFMVLICIAEYVLHLAFLDTTVTPATIALVHTLYNIAITLILAPLSGRLVRMVERIVPASADEDEVEEELVALDDRLLKVPSVAIGECNNLTVKMAKLAEESISHAFQLIPEYNIAFEKKVLKAEDQLDTYEDKLGNYLVKASAHSLSEKDSRTVSKMLHIIGDFERIGDYAVNLQETAKEMHEKNIHFHMEDINVLTAALTEILSISVQCYENDDAALASRVEPLEQIIDGLVEEIRSRQINSMQTGRSTMELGFILGDLLTSYERISDHCSNIAVAVIEMEKGSLESHSYLNSVKTGENREYTEVYNEFDQKYSIRR